MASGREIKPSNAYEWFDHWRKCKICNSQPSVLNPGAPIQKLCRVGRRWYASALEEMRNAQSTRT